MGQRLKDLFTKADALGGLKAKIRLATLVKLTSTQAEVAPDDTSTIERVQRALEQISRELGIIPNAPPTPSPKSNPPSDRGLRYLQVTADLLGQRALYLGNVDATVARMTEAAALTMNVARVSVWMYDRARSLIRCADLFAIDTGKHSAGLELKAQDYPDYFAALQHERTIAADNAHTDPRTAAFSPAYLTPLGIGAMLDVPIWMGAEMVGVICHEHVGGGRRWTDEDETFAVVLANLIGFAMEGRKG